jgi:hypothetical protein
MSAYQRPWWLVVNRPQGLVTTVREEGKPDERIFTVRGEPLVQGLAWLTWGPVAALVVVLFLAGLAIALDVKNQPQTIRGVVVIAFLLLPAFAWLAVSLLLARLSRKHLRAERQKSCQECIIRLNQKEKKLFLEGTEFPQPRQVPYEEIHQARVRHPIGKRDGQLMQLALETDEGSVVLLNESLGTKAQKVDLATEIEKAVRTDSRT